MKTSVKKSKMLKSIAKKIGIWKLNRLDDIYFPGEEKDFDEGSEAEVLYRRITHCLKKDLELRTNQTFFQWTEERSVNHHRYTRPIKWPVGLIRVNNSTRKTQEIINHRPLQEYDLGIVVAANSSGGILPESIYDYAYSIHSERGKPIQSYRDAEEKIMEQFGNEEHFNYVNINIVDYIRLEGLDATSGGRILIELGNIPIIIKHPRNRVGFRIDMGELPPKDAVELPIY